MLKVPLMLKSIVQQRLFKPFKDNQALFKKGEIDRELHESSARTWRDRGAKIGRNVRIIGIIDSVNPELVSIGDNSVIGGGGAILTHCPVKGPLPCTIGKNVYIGYGAIVLPGVVINDNCVIGAGSVVTKNVPGNSIVAGNPGRVIRKRGKTELSRYIQSMEEGKLIGFNKKDDHVN